ncbi:hypothetical protein QZN22_31730, partial [Burkholderia vietnamiensis]|uniref:hypothetical protein n=1 Tax=Burkholderia vietnamiensis TaxID=60552 RepID=UPI002653580A
ATLLTYQTHCALPDFRGKLGCLLVHGSILSRIRASTKFGAVHAGSLRLRRESAVALQGK